MHYSGYQESELQECVDMMIAYLSAPLKYEALYKKYSSKKFMKAAIFAQDWIDRNAKDDYDDENSDDKHESDDDQDE